MKNKPLSSVTALLFVLLLPIILFHYRELDNNALCRWPWVFGSTPPMRLFLLQAALAIIALLISGISWPDNYPALLIIPSVIIGTALMGEPEIIMDTSRYFSQAKYLTNHGIIGFWRAWGHGLSAWTDLPLVPFIYGLILSAAGESRIFLQILTTMFFAGSVLLTHLLARELFDRETGLLAGLLLLCQPYLLLHIPLTLSDLPTMFFMLLAVYSFLRALDSKSLLPLPGAALAIFLAFFAKYSTWLMLSIIPVIFLVKLPDDPAKIRRRGLMVAGLTLLLILPVILGLRGVIISQIQLLIEYQRPGLDRWSEGLVSTFFFQIHPLVTGAAVGGIAVGLYRREKKMLIPAWLLILLVLVLQVRRIRYLLPIFPMLAVAGAYGLRYLNNVKLQRFLVLTAVTASLTLTFGAYLPFTRRLSAANLQKAGHFLDGLDSRRIAIYTAGTEAHRPNLAINLPILDLFTSKEIYSINPPAVRDPAGINQTSSFRFTWEQKMPDFYNPPKTESEPPAPLLVISSGLPGGLPEQVRQRISGYSKHRLFDQNSGLFSYRTFATIHYD